MGILRNPFLEPDSLDLRRPRIPKAPALPRIPGPRGGPAYRPDPRDERREAPEPSRRSSSADSRRIGVDLDRDLFR